MTAASHDTGLLPRVVLAALATLVLAAVVLTGTAAHAQTAPSPSPGATSPAATPSPSTTPDPNAPASPAPAEPRVVTQADNGSSVTLVVGETLEVRLDGAWRGPTSMDALYLTSFSQTSEKTTAQLQALHATSRPVRLTASPDSSCRHAEQLCSLTTGDFTLDVSVTGQGSAPGDYPCRPNPTLSPYPGTLVVDERDNGTTVTVKQGNVVYLTLNGCDSPWQVPIADGPLYRERASYQASGGNNSLFRAMRPGTSTITSSTDLVCFHAAQPCARPSAGFGLTVQVIAASCPATLTLSSDAVTATGSTGLTVSGDPGQTVDLFAYSQPSTTYRVVRSATLGSDGTAGFSVRPPTNTRLYAQQRGCAAGPSVVLNVRTALTLTAQRLGTRLYRFAGDSLPARPGGLIVSLYRETPTGREVLTAQARADGATGEWTLDRRFTGTGRFGFLVRTGQDLTNAPGASHVRSRLVY